MKKTKKKFIFSLHAQPPSPDTPRIRIRIRKKNADPKPWSETGDAVPFESEKDMAIRSLHISFKTSPCIVVGGILLAGDELLGVEQLLVGTGSDLVNHAWLQVHEHSSRMEMEKCCHASHDRPTYKM